MFESAYEVQSLGQLSRQREMSRVAAERHTVLSALAQRRAERRADSRRRQQRPTAVAVATTA